MNWLCGKSLLKFNGICATPMGSCVGIRIPFTNMGPRWGPAVGRIFTGYQYGTPLGSCRWADLHGLPMWDTVGVLRMGGFARANNVGHCCGPADGRICTGYQYGTPLRSCGWAFF